MINNTYWDCSNATDSSVESIFNGSFVLENPDPTLSFQLMKGVHLWSVEFSVASEWTLSRLTLLFPFDTNVIVSIDDSYESQPISATGVSGNVYYNLDLTSDNIVLDSGSSHILTVKSVSGVFTSYLTADCKESNASDFAIVARNFNLTIPPGVGGNSFWIPSDGCPPLEFCGTIVVETSSDKDFCPWGLTFDITDELGCVTEGLALISFILLLPFFCILGYWLIFRPRAPSSCGKTKVNDTSLDQLLEGTRDHPWLPKDASFAKDGKPVCCDEIWPDEKDIHQVGDLFPQFRDLGLSYDRRAFNCWAANKFGDPHCTIDRNEFEKLFADKNNIEEELLLSLKTAESSMQKPGKRR